MWKNFNQTDRRILATATVLLLLMLYFLYDDSLLLPKDDFKNLVEIGRIDQVDQDVRRKIKKQFTWKSAHSKDSIHVGDSVFTGKESTAVIQLKDGRSLTIEPNSLIVFTTNGDQLSLDLRFGRFAGNVDGCVKVTVKGVEKELCGKNAALEIDSDGEIKNKTETMSKELISWVQRPSQPHFHLDHDTLLKASWKPSKSFSRFHFQISKQRDFKKVLIDEKIKWNHIETRHYPKEGSYYIRIQGDDIKGRPAGYSAIEKLEIKSLPLLTVTHPTPQQQFQFATNVDGELSVKNQFDVRFTYPLKGVRFEIEIARDEDFKNLSFKRADINAQAVTVSGLPEGSYKLRVRDATRTDGMTRPWSSPVSFSIDILDPPRLPAPKLLTRKINHLAPSKEPVSLKWEKIPGADEYLIETSQDADFTRKNTFKTATTKFEVPEFEPGKTHFRVYAATKKGTRGEPSQTGALDVRLKQPVAEPIAPLEIMGKTPDDPGGPQEIQAAWTDLELAASYLVQLAEDSQFKKKSEIRISQPATSMVLPRPGTYYWRVQGLDKNGKPLTEFSVPSTVSYDLKVPLALPELQEPQDQMTLFFQRNLESYVWFEWKPVRQAVQYQLEISQDPAFQTKLFDRMTKSPRLLVKERLPEGLLYWRVRAQGDDLRSSHWSPPRVMNLMTGRAPAGRPRGAQGK